MLASSLGLTHFDKTQPGVALTGSNRSPASWHYVALLDAWCGLHAPISSAYLRPWVLSLPAPPAKRLHWCVLNKTLRCRSARDSPKIYVTFMTFTFRKGYRGPGSFLAADAALPICVMIWDEFQLLESCIKKKLSAPYDRSGSPAVAFLVWKSVTDGCLLARSQGSNVIVTIVSLLPTDWTCCRLCEWQIWGQPDHICRLSLRFACFVSISTVWQDICIPLCFLLIFSMICAHHCSYFFYFIKRNCELTESILSFCVWQTQTVATKGARSDVRGKAGGVVELECSFPPSDPGAVASASLHVVEWVRQGLEIPVLIKFGSYAPRVHPQYEGELLRIWLWRVIQLNILRLPPRIQRSDDAQ